jgi:glycosyltransferase involved in cell wall biosynthesis
MSEAPLVSCLMVTLPVCGRLARLKQSLGAYLAQTYPRRELVIVVDGRAPEPTTAQIKAHVAALGRDDIRIVEPSEPLSLGALRNLSRASARGEVFCQWDDDDLHHPERVQRQLDSLVQLGGEAVCLQHFMQFFPADRSLYCINWRMNDAWGHPATLMVWASAPIAYPETGPHAERGEDMQVVFDLQRRGVYAALGYAPHLYVYVSHGGNTYGEAHHRAIAVEWSLRQGLVRRREAELRRDLAAIDFGPGAVTVMGADGAAFTIDDGR